MAEVEATVINNVGEETAGVAGKQATGLECKQFENGKADLPQDYLSLSPPEDQATSPSAQPFSKNDVDAARHEDNGLTWVSPNKSDEVPSSKESSPDSAPSEQTENPEFQLKESFISSKASLEAEYDAEFEPIAKEEEPSKLDLSIVGQHLEKIQISDAPADDEAVLDASTKEFVKIIHGDKECVLVLPSESSILEMSESLAASLDVRGEIVGLKSTAVLIDDEAAFKHHGDVVIPLSALASGQLGRLLRRTVGTEGIPSFNLVTSNFDSFSKDFQDCMTVAPARAREDDEISSGEESFSFVRGEGAVYADAFLELMDKSDEFDAFEKNSLLRFGMDQAEQANILFQASFRVAMFTDEMSHFVQGLKAIAAIQLASSTDCDDADKSDDTKRKASMTMFGLTDFIIAADELFESADLTAEKYVALVHAIFSGHPSVQSLFDLYHNPDFLLACDSDDELRASLCLRDLLHLGKRLEPLQQPSPLNDDELLKWAIKTGLANFSSRLLSSPTGMPREFVNIIYHMFSSGDQMVLSACQRFLDTDDSDAVEEMLLREWDIYCRNEAFRKEIETPEDVLAKSSTLELQSSLAEASNETGNGDVPDVLLTAVACLVDAEEISEDAAAAIIASYSKGNQLLRDCYDHYIQFGNVDEFLNILKVLAAEEKEPVAPLDAFRNVLKDMREFGRVEIAALRLASDRKDKELIQALVDFKDGLIDATLFRQTLLRIAQKIIAETTDKKLF